MRTRPAGITLTHEEARRVYDRVGARQDTLAFYEDPATELLMRHGQFGFAHRIIELGSVTGRFAGRLFSDHLSQDARYRTLDISPAMFCLARERLAAFAPRAEVILSDGSVRKAGEQVRITVQLIDAGSQEHLWSGSYDAEVGDVLGVQGTIAERVAEALDVYIRGRERRRLGKTGTSHAGSYDHYLKGRHVLNKWERAPLEEARDHFQRALALDSTFAEAWAGLADFYVVFGYLSLLTPEEARTHGRAAAEHALAHDEEVAEAHSALASILTDYFWDWEAAEHHFRRALELDPSYALAHQYFAECLRDQGRFDEALAEVRQAQALDPLSPYAVLVEGVILWLGRQYEDALTRLRQLLRVHGAYPPAHLFMGLVYLDTGQYEEALTALERGDPSRSLPDAVAPRGMAYARMGRRAEAKAVLSELDVLSAQCYVSPFLRALIFLDLGDHKRALSLIEQAYEDRSWFLRLLKVLPAVDPLRSDVRFQALLEKVGLAEPGVVPGRYSTHRSS